MAELFDIFTLDVDKNTNITLTDVFQDIANLTMAQPSVAGAWYETGFSFTSTLDILNKSLLFRFSTNGGSTWNEFSHEPKDTTDAEPFVYLFPQQPAVAAHNLILQARKTDTAGIAIVSFSDMWIKRIN